MKKITSDQATKIYDILIEHLDAVDDVEQRFEFVSYISKHQRNGHSFRFTGSIGEESKFHNNVYQLYPYVGCAVVDYTEENKLKINTANHAIIKIMEKDDDEE